MAREYAASGASSSWKWLPIALASQFSWWVQVWWVQLLLADHLALAPILPLVHFFRTRKCLMCQGRLLYSILGTCWWNILCHLRLLWCCCNPCEGKLLESCWVWLTVPFGSCSPCSPSCMHSSVPGSLQPCSWWQDPQLSVLDIHQAFLPCSFDAFRFIPHPNPVAFVSSQTVWEELCTSARSAAVFAGNTGILMGCLTLSLIFLPVHLPCCAYQSVVYSCPGNAQIPLKPSFSLPCIFDDSNFCQQVLSGSPSHCKRKDTCNVIKLSPACRQVLRSFCGCAVTHISWDADVFQVYLQAHPDIDALSWFCSLLSEPLHCKSSSMPGM